MATRINRNWRFAAYPDGMYKPSDFHWQEDSVPPLQEGEILIHNLLLSLDPTNRAWGFPKETYMPQLQIGEVMRGLGIGVVVESKRAEFPPGSYVTGLIGWQDYLVTDVPEVGGVPSVGVFPRDAKVPLSTYLGLFGFIGLTAYYGLLHIGAARPGETVVVSAAAGATGSLVAQIARIRGCRVIGIAGGREKCAWLRDELQLDGVIDYKAESVAERLPALCPNGIDVYYENVGGEILEAVLDNLALNARIVVAGMISMYNQPNLPGPRNLVNLILQRGRMQGFVIFDFLRDAAAVQKAMADLAQWHHTGRLQFRTHVVEGLENAPAAVNMLFTGQNTGKLMVRINADPAGMG